MKDFWRNFWIFAVEYHFVEFGKINEKKADYDLCSS